VLFRSAPAAQPAATPAAQPSATPAVQPVEGAEVSKKYHPLIKENAYKYIQEKVNDNTYILKDVTKGVKINDVLEGPKTGYALITIDRGGKKLNGYFSSDKKIYIDRATNDRIRIFDGDKITITKGEFKSSATVEGPKKAPTEDKDRYEKNYQKLLRELKNLKPNDTGINISLNDKSTINIYRKDQNNFSYENDFANGKTEKGTISLNNTNSFTYLRTLSQKFDDKTEFEMAFKPVDVAKHQA
jgi:hypothetical protein